ncbi:MAG: tripartite tricarboxylate transporter substrate binding protein [Betaproteobacteria bacterium]
MRFLHAKLLSVLLVTFYTIIANSEPYPDRPIKVIVPYGPGGSDVQLRMLQPYISQILGQPFVIENRAGGGGAMGTMAVRNSNSDGYTLLFTGTAPLTVNPHVKQQQYKLEDFIPIGNVTATALVVVSRANAPFKSFIELIAFAKKNPGKVNMASNGIGTTTHIVGEVLQLETGVKFTHIPYTGLGQVVVALLNESADIIIGIPGSFMSQINSGAFRAVATTGNIRSEFLPDIPTIKEMGFKVIEETKFGLVAPRGVSAAIVSKLSNALTMATQNKEYIEKMRANYVTTLYLDSTRFSEALSHENSYWSEMLNRKEFRELIGP